MSILKVQEIQHTNATSALTISTGGNVTVPSGDLIVDTNTLVVDASANKVGIGTASPATAELDVSGKIRASSGLLFGTDTADANLLSDYEEGGAIEFTLTGAGSTTFHQKHGHYTKVGRLINVSGRIRINSHDNSATGGLAIDNLPFVAASLNNLNYWVVPLLGDGSWDTGRSNLVGFLPVGTDNLNFYYNSGSNLDGLSINDMGDGAVLAFSATYYTS